MTSAALAVLLLGASPARAESGGVTPGLRHVGAPFAVDTSVRSLHRQALRASRAHERARLAADRQRRTVGRLDRSLRAKQAEYRGLRQAVGAAAAEHYRAGAGALLPGARLMLSDSPEQFLARSAAMERGTRAADQLTENVRRAEAELAREQSVADRALARLRRDQARQLAWARHLTVQLTRARQQAARMASGRAGGHANGHADGGADGHASARVVVQRGAGGCATSSGGGGSAASTGNAWVAPVERYRLSAGFAARGSRWSHGHTGQDFAVTTGTPVRAVGAGVVAGLGCGDAFGHQLVLRHPGGFYTQYAHLSLLQARPGQRVHTGEQIGLSGNTGNSSGPHLHFEVRMTPQVGSGVDPVPWLRARGVKL
ncbi:peptidoglycan DD-metalloendopeptidase family protein [Streptomyces sp. 549]|uniref:M23 family metallopeptidase n=1 Tax=Streptomyces sp. 549 TaxID=3049076 RepID=UPI0024C2DEA3|nr:peptidoglycan DD-metalloendopeptidase family protein [Streptomyces sp. 549]MDK1473131.1 peptidoglycan DD-metalloendopeptidase family protein [Streptomyces sp. 549]